MNEQELIQGTIEQIRRFRKMTAMLNDLYKLIEDLNLGGKVIAAIRELGDVELLDDALALFS